MLLLFIWKSVVQNKTMEQIKIEQKKKNIQKKQKWRPMKTNKFVKLVVYPTICEDRRMLKGKVKIKNTRAFESVVKPKNSSAPKTGRCKPCTYEGKGRAIILGVSFLLNLPQVVRISRANHNFFFVLTAQKKYVCLLKIKIFVFQQKQ